MAEGQRGVDRRTFLAAAVGAVAAACSSSGDKAAPTTAGTTGPTTATTGPTGPTTAAASLTTTVAPTTVAPTTTLAPVVAAPSPTNGFAANPFELGVASGDPTSSAVILWTHVNTASSLADRPAWTVAWDVAHDEQFTQLAASGSATTVPAAATTLHVDANGLTPDTWYFYRFRSDTFVSTVGRTRTLPAADAAPAGLRFGFASCQDWQGGYYAAHRDVAASKLDLMVWLGDYIYEYGPDPAAVRQHTGGVCTTYADYAARYALYRSDPDLQAAHASCPWLVIWDDHEVENNYADATSEKAGTDPAAFRARRAQAYQAWWDFTPTRLTRPTGPDLKIYRDLAFGRLAHVFLLDGRQYRSNQACGAADQGINLAPPCEEWSQPDRTMLGTDQERWLLDGIGASSATWNVVGNQVVLSDARLNGVVLNYDQWDGYPVARQRLVQGIAATGKTNVVVVTGDIHLAAVADVTAGTIDAGAVSPGVAAPVATELVGTSISSGALLPPAVESQVSKFPALRYLNAHNRGWVLNEVTATEWRATYRVVADVTKADSAVTTDASFVVVPTKPGATRV